MAADTAQTLGHRAVRGWGPSTNRSRTTNDPLRRADGRTSAGRRVRDLYRAYLAAVPNPTSEMQQAQVLAAAELVTAAENARAELLAGRGDVEQIVRLENLASRAVRRLGLKRTEMPQLSLRDRLLADIQAEQDAAADEGDVTNSNDAPANCEHVNVPEAGE